MAEEKNADIEASSSRTEEAVVEMPPDSPPEAQPTADKPKEPSSSQSVSEVKETQATETKDTAINEVKEQNPEPIEKQALENPEVVQAKETSEEKTQENHNKEDNIAADETKEETPAASIAAKPNEEMIEIREIVKQNTGVPEIDSIFKEGLPKICNILFAGSMSSGKTHTSLKLILSAAKRGEKVLYISFHDSEEKIINILNGMDKDVLNYINSGNINIKKLDTFGIARECGIKKKELDQNPQEKILDCTYTLDFIEIISPSLVVVDSLSALQLSFSDDKMCYRHYIDNMFKYFEKLGLRAVFIKELVKEDELHKEFLENILADCILFFSTDKRGRRQIKLIKDYPVAFENKKKGIFSFLFHGFKKKSTNN